MDVHKKEYLKESFLSLISELSLNEQIDLVESIKDKFYKESFSAEKIKIPCSIFSDKLSCSESIIVYLKDNLNLDLKQISNLFNKSVSNLHGRYKNAKKKFNGKLNLNEKVFFIPLSDLNNNKLGVMEQVVAYLKENYSLGYNQIAKIISRNYQTVRTSYKNYEKKKRGKK